MNRYNTKGCKHCGTKTSILASFNGRDLTSDKGDALRLVVIGGDEAAWVPCRGCGKLRIAKKVFGVMRADIKCDGRCRSATGHNCECSCGGANHGCSHAA
jgi:hypothetical protein